MLTKTRLSARSRIATVAAAAVALSVALGAPLASQAGAATASTTGSVGAYHFSDSTAASTGVTCRLAKGDISGLVVVPPVVKPRSKWQAAWQGQYVEWTVTVQVESGSTWTTVQTLHPTATFAAFGHWTRLTKLPAITTKKTFSHSGGAYRVKESLAWVRPTATTVAHPTIDGTATRTITHYHYPYKTRTARTFCQNRKPVLAAAPTWTVTPAVSWEMPAPVTDPDGDSPLRLKVLYVTQGSSFLHGFAAVDGTSLIVTPTSSERGGAVISYEAVDPAGATSAVRSLSVDVVPNPSTVTVSGTRSAVSGQPLTFTAKVASAGDAIVTPTGTVQFVADGTSIAGCAAVVLHSQVATCSVPDGLLGGSHSIVVRYSGDANYATASNSASPLAEPVGSAATSTALAANPSLPSAGPVTLTATVSVTSPGTVKAGAPTGTVDFQASGFDIVGCTSVAVDSSGVATCTDDLPVSAASATYSGDSSFTGSSS